MKVINEIEVIEVDGKEIAHRRLKMRINSHWNRDNFIVLEIDGKEYTVVAELLRKSIDNAMNWK